MRNNNINNNKNININNNNNLEMARTPSSLFSGGVCTSIL